jgi:hypothetical protein
MSRVVKMGGRGGNGNSGGMPATRGSGGPIPQMDEETSEAMGKAFGPEDEYTIPLDPHALDPEKVVEAIKILRLQYLGAVQQIMKHQRFIATMGSRLEAMIRTITMDRPEGSLVSSARFMKIWESIMKYEREIDSIMRIPTPERRLARTIIWNTTGTEEERVPIKPTEVGLVEWLLDPKFDADARVKIAENLDFIDDRATFLEVVSKIRGTWGDRTH